MLWTNLGAHHLFKAHVYGGFAVYLEGSCCGRFGCKSYFESLYLLRVGCNSYFVGSSLLRVGCNSHFEGSGY